MKKALLTGITAKTFLSSRIIIGKGYEVHGLIRRASTFNTGRIDHLYKDRHINGVKLFCITATFPIPATWAAWLKKYSRTKFTISAPKSCPCFFWYAGIHRDVTGLGALRLLDAIAKRKLKPNFIKPHLQKCSARPWNYRLKKQRRSIPARRMLRQSFRFLDHQKLSRAYECSQSTEFCSTTNLRPRRNFRHAQNNSRLGAHQTRLEEKLF